MPFFDKLKKEFNNLNLGKPSEVQFVMTTALQGFDFSS